MCQSHYFIECQLVLAGKCSKYLCMFFRLTISLKGEYMRHKDVSIDPFSSMYWWYIFFLSNAMWLEICSNNLCLDLHMIMHRFWYYITWPLLQLEYEPTFPGRVATFVMCKHRTAGVKNVYNYFENLPANTIHVSRHFGSFLSLWFFYNGMRTQDHWSQKQMNLKRYPGYRLKGIKVT